MNAIHQLLTDHIGIWTAADTAKKSGRGRSSGNAASVYGINKLRELIYEFAATGRIVDHKNDAKQYLLGEVSEFIMGQAPPGNECNTNGDGVIFVKTGEFGSLFPEVKEWTTKPLKLAKNGDVLICVVGATIGKLNLAIDCAIGRSVAAIRPAQVIETKYLYFVLIPFTLRLRERSRGSAQGVIGKAELSSVKIRVPSINEQRQIVAKVDELMALCDQLETQHCNAAEAHEKLVSHLLGTLTLSQSTEDFSANWRRIAAHFDTLFITEASIGALKQTLLQLAVMGKLVPQDPNDEPASELLKRIQAEKAKLIAEGKIKKDKPLTEITEEEKPFALPEAWVWTTLATISLVNPRNNAEDNSPASFVPMTMIGAKFNSLHDQETRIWKEIKQGFTHFAEGDIGVAKITPCFENSKACVFSGLLSGVGAGTTELHIVRPINATLAPYYVLAYLKSPQFLLVGETKMTGTAGQKRLPKDFVESNPFPLPPLAEQHRIVAKVDELMALCDQLKSRITEANQLQQKLADVVVEQAISE